MVKFNFDDRPDEARLSASLSAYPNITSSELVQLFLDFQWTYREMQRSYDQILARYGLSESKFILLMFLRQAPKQQLLPSELALKLGATRATTTKLLNKMAADHWVEKVKNLEDTRSTLIRLLPKGQEILATFLPINFHSTDAYFSDFNAEEITQFNYLLGKIKQNTQNLKQEMELD